MSDIRYGNDLAITEFAREAEACVKSMSAHLRDGNLDSAFISARLAQKKLDKFMERLNELQPTPPLPDAYTKRTVQMT